MQQDTIIATYERRQQKYTAQFRSASNRHYRLGLLRLLSLLLSAGCFYLYYIHSMTSYLLAGIAGIFLFFLLMKAQQKTQRKKMLAKTLSEINQEEAAYLQQGILAAADGIAYKDSRHAYADDLDLFGHRSLYQHLNRTATQMGGQQLAQTLLSELPAATIRDKQEAIAELSGQLDTRQRFYAMARLARDNEQVHRQLLQWAATPEAPLNKVLLVLAWLLPALLGVVIIFYAVTREDQWWQLITRLVPVNLAVFFIALKRIRKAIAGTERVQETLQAYATLLQQAEETRYNSPWLKELQQQLEHKGTKASVQVQQLAKIYTGMEHIQNPFAAIGMNGLYLYHIHALYSLLRWKNNYAASIPVWLHVIGELEMLHSLANLHYNNPDFCFPQLNNQAVISFKALGHPMIPAARRVCNDVSFEQQRFLILTGSNMSGKSTFLRTLGINMVLAGTGAPVCATESNIQPMKLYVSMRQSDSLADSESYFFAEVKRLQYIISQINTLPCFVLLDEILRGTNSDDKRSGTIGVIEKIIRTQCVGAIATHDLEVCLTTDEHPEILTNKCFEVAITNDELVFDYVLRDGICRNKSATFLMKKMEII